MSQDFDPKLRTQASHALVAQRLSFAARRLGQTLQSLEKEKAQARPEDSFRLIEDYDRLVSEVYKVRSMKSAQAAPLLNQAEDLLADTAQSLLLIAQPSSPKGERNLFISQYRETWRQQFGLFIFTASIFMATVFMGWSIGVSKPQFIRLFVSREMLEMILDHHAWFARIMNSPLAEMFQIASNNIRVAFLGYLFGSMLGLGGMYILAMNGLMFGAILGYCWTHDFGEPLTEFVMSHGPLELTIIVASCFAGLLIGREFYARPFSTMGLRLKLAFQDSMVLVMGILPWLVLAACFECFVSPFPYLDTRLKLLVGWLLAALFWAWSLKRPKPAAKI